VKSIRTGENHGVARRKARGFSGTDIFTCQKLGLSGKDGAQIDIGFVGEPTDANRAPLEECLRNNVIPIISPTARGEDGKIYNCNADVAAARAAIALKARRLVFMSDVPGLLRNPRMKNLDLASACQ